VLEPPPDLRISPHLAALISIEAGRLPKSKLEKAEIVRSGILLSSIFDGTLNLWIDSAGLSGY